MSCVGSFILLNLQRWKPAHPIIAGVNSLLHRWEWLTMISFSGRGRRDVSPSWAVHFMPVWLTRTARDDDQDNNDHKSLHKNLLVDIVIRLHYYCNTFKKGGQPMERKLWSKKFNARLGLVSLNLQMSGDMWGWARTITRKKASHRLFERPFSITCPSFRTRKGRHGRIFHCLGNLHHDCFIIHDRQSQVKQVKECVMRGVIAKRLRRHTVRLRQGIEPYPFPEPTNHLSRKAGQKARAKHPWLKVNWQPSIAFSGVYRQTYQGLKRFWKGLNSSQRSAF